MMRDRYYQAIKDFEHSAEKTDKYQKWIIQINEQIDKIKPMKNSTKTERTLKLF